MRRLLTVLSASLALAILLPTFGAAQEATPAADIAAPALARTNIHYVSPFTPDGLNPGLTATATEEGTCGFASSHALGRPDAWDCISESDAVYDPCFENPFVAPDEPGQVACFDSPFTTDVVLLTLSDPLVREKEAMADPGPGQAVASTAIEDWDLPWALELGNGEQCTLFGGTLTVVAGQVAHYGCTGGGMVLGETDHSQPVWVVNYIAEGEYVTTLVEVLAAWS